MTRECGEAQVELGQLGQSTQQLPYGGQQVSVLRTQPPHVQCPRWQCQGLQLGELHPREQHLQVGGLQVNVVHHLLETTSKKSNQNVFV